MSKHNTTTLLSNLTSGHSYLSNGNEWSFTYGTLNPLTLEQSGGISSDET